MQQGYKGVIPYYETYEVVQQQAREDDSKADTGETSSEQRSDGV